MAAMNYPANEFPMISILVAARNEAPTLRRCLDALDALHYPKDRLDIWIGNDHSTDATEQIVLDFAKDRPHFKYLLINSFMEGLRGKTNVLAQLAHKVSGDYFFYCDADIAVQPTWVEHMLALFTPTTGAIVGVTRMTPTGLFASMQSLEWLFSLGGMRMFWYLNVPFTGMGNNMAVTKESYWKVGGYEKIGFSIVEDFALFTAILREGYTFVQGYEEEIVSVSLPVSTFPELLRQRKRWVKGAMEAPFAIRLSFYLSAVFLPFLLVLLLFAPGWALGISLLHYLAVTVGCMAGAAILNQKDLFKYCPIFWFYFNLSNLLMLLNYLLPTPTVWKGRTY